MLKVGTLAKGNELGFKDRGKYIYHACLNCGKQRWVRIRNGKVEYVICSKCGLLKMGLEKSGKNHPLWRGGRRHRSDGYMRVYVEPNDFFSAMAGKRNHHVYEHRLVMAQHLGRLLHSWEAVHHKNGIKDDNRIENLELLTNATHYQVTILENRIKLLESRITLLEAENILLKETQYAN